jgi:hypothetical protein
MRLVNDDCEITAAVLVSDFIQNEGKLLHRADDNLLAAFDELAQIPRVRRVSYGRTHLGKVLDSRLNLLIENSAVRK